MSSPPSIDSLTGSKIVIDNVTVDVQEKIASGNDTCIYKALDSRGSLYALKAMKAADEITFQSYIRQYDFMRKASNCPNIISVFCQSIDRASHTAIFLMEMCEENLTSYISSHFEQGIDDKTKVEIFQAVAAAIHNLHAQQPSIIHRKVSTDSVLFSHGAWKLSGFSSATTTIYRKFESADARIQAQNDIESNTDLRYRAPELLDLDKNLPIYRKVDVWALGCLLYRLCTNKDAFETADQINNVSLTWPENVQIHPKLKSMIKGCLEPDPRKRPSIDQVLSKLYEYFPEWVNPRWQEKKQAGKPFFNMPKYGAATMPANKVRRKPIVFKEFKVEPNKEEDLVAAPRRVKFVTVNLGNGRKRMVPHRRGSNCDMPNVDAQPPAQDVTAPSKANPFALMKASHAQTTDFSKRKVSFNAELPISDPFAEVKKIPFVLASDPAPESKPPQKVEAPAKEPETKEEVNIDAEALVNEMKNDHRGLIKRLLEGSDELMSASINSLIKSSPVLGTRFLFKLLHKCGNRVQRILANSPTNPSKEVQAVLDARQNVISKFPMFEGNLGLDQLRIKSEGRMPPVGEPPICTAAAVELQGLLEASLTLLEKLPIPEFAEEGIFSYTIVSYIVLKMKQAKKADETIFNTVIPKLVEEHGRLKPIVRKLGDQNFPSAPFNFDDPNSVRNLHCPTYIQRQKPA
ncbi:hypothetical protein TRFO_01583 [Tritrichomonas foetus]|uniref:non-specific serine/threonine protein kinase n=1 Tax=Tritrichomonas foetus TaxID=1144522 RepID=A0A1J4JXH6_9EUKA|nr:hypothetical protein TRFO_01583 [Tritrichomonas foetus]|eukprot:OHT03857.1 hypothetical protein TRFO_01583 [Tritrichomonas foetus]